MKKKKSLTADISSYSHADHCVNHRRLSIVWIVHGLVLCSRHNRQRHDPYMGFGLCPALEEVSRSLSRCTGRRSMLRA